MPAIQPTTVLIVDDHLANLGVLCASLTRAGYKVLVAETGLQALERAAIAQPAAILLDVIMPDMDGFETCRRLKQQAATHAIPVLFMSALTDTIDKVQGFAVGGVDYVTKPFEVEEVLARVATHTALYTLRQELAQKNRHLEDALAQVKRLSGFLPMCAGCKKIRDDEGYWHSVEAYITTHSEAILSHGMCADCMRRFYPEFIKDPQA